MSFVVDAAMVASWLLPDCTPPAEALLERALAAPPLAPDLMRHELRGLILEAVRRARVSADFVPWALARFAELLIGNAGPGDDARVLDLATAHGLSAQDGAYLALARERALPLATLDRRLAQAARREALDIIGPLAT